jgi:hypothetical protein
VGVLRRSQKRIFIEEHPRGLWHIHQRMLSLRSAQRQHPLINMQARINDHSHGQQSSIPQDASTACENT